MDLKGATSCLTFRIAFNDVIVTKAWESWIGLACNNSFQIVQTWQLRLHTRRRPTMTRVLLIETEEKYDSLSSLQK